jgi:hypothetical protein
MFKQHESKVLKTFSYFFFVDALNTSLQLFRQCGIFLYVFVTVPTVWYFSICLCNSSTVWYFPICFSNCSDSKVLIQWVKKSNGGQKQQAEEGQIIQWVKKSNGGQKQQAEGQIIQWVKKSNDGQKQ